MTSTHSHQKHFLSGILSTCLILSIPPTANAEFYKWVDDQGRTHYSDERPKNEQIEVKKIRVRTTTNAQDATDNETENLSQTAARDDTDNTEKTLADTQADSDANETQQKLTAIDTAKQQRCEQARTELLILNKDIPVYLDDTEQYRLNWAGDTYTGERSYLDDEERETARNKAKEAVAEFCQKPSDEKAQAIARKKWIYAEYCLLNQTILKDLQSEDIKASKRQLNKQQALTDKYCNNTTNAFSIDDPEPEIFPR